MPSSQPQCPSKPAIVTTAIRLLYLTLILGLARCILDWSRLPSFALPGLTLFLMLGVFLIAAGLIHRIDQGHNWAWITFLVLFLLGKPFTIQSLFTSVTYSTLSGVLGVAQLLLQVLALVMLFGRTTRPWFHPAAPLPLATQQ